MKAIFLSWRFFTRFIFDCFVNGTAYALDSSKIVMFIDICSSEVREAKNLKIMLHLPVILSQHP
ncbi:MAG: hypothetical protein PHC50_07880 [Candidatus Cloacimonetes bacterium]|nr:hypothetical protein [Candidatus Cloacimonadota bacterium]